MGPTAADRRRWEVPILGLIGVGVTVGVAEASTTIPAWERRVAEWLFELPETLTPVFEVTMQLGTKSAAVVLGLVLALMRRRRAGAAVVVAGLTAGVVSDLVKDLVDRARPSLETLGHLPREAIESFGFPSTHTAIATALAVTLWLAAGAADVPRSVVAVAVVLAGATAVARIHLGVHWPLDVLGGAAVGTTVGGLVGMAVRSGARR